MGSLAGATVQKEEASSVLPEAHAAEAISGSECGITSQGTVTVGVDSANTCRVEVRVWAS